MNFTRIKNSLRLVAEWPAWSFARSAPEPPGNAPVALIACMSDWPYTLRTESMLGLGLKLAGWRVKFLLRDRSLAHAAWWLKSAGFREIVYFSDYAVNPSPEERRRLKEEVRASGTTFDAVKTWSLQGCLIGPQILASISRKIFSAGFDVDSPDVQARVESQLDAAVGFVLTAQRALDALRPDLLGVNEANYTYFACLVDSAIQRRIRTIQFLQPNREDAMIFWRLNSETRRTHPAAVTRATLDRLALEPWTEERERAVQQIFADRYGGKWYLQSRNQIGAEEKSRAEICSELSLDPTLPLAVVFSSVLWDANLFYGRDLFADNGEWFIETLRAACANRAVNWLVKLHPVNSWKRELEGIGGELAEIRLIRERVGELPSHVKLLLPDCGISTRSLFEHSAYGVTVRGTSGMEMPCFGKPVVTGGTGRYSGLGFTIDPKTSEAYRKILSELHTVQALSPDQTLSARRHMYAAFVLRPWLMKSFVVKMRKPRGAGDLDYAQLRPAATTLDEVRVNGDLAAWAAWATRGETEDFVSTPSLVASCA